MRSGRTRVMFWRRPLAIIVLVILLFMLLITAVSANGLSEELMWVTICHHPPGDPENAQTMVIYWSALDKCLSYFGDFMGACP